MTPHEIKPKQLRALLLLLVLLPLIPTVLMVRFVLDLVQIEHAASLEKLRGIHQQTVLKAENAFARQIGGRVGAVTADDVYAYYRGVLDQDLAITVLDEMDKIVAGDGRGSGGLIAQTSLHNLSLPWRLEISLANQAPLNAGVKERIHTYVWTVIVAIIAIVIIATAAAITVGRQIALHELKTTSVATVAHELRTPLASMRMLVDTLREGRYRGESQLQEYLDMCASESLRLSRLIDNFLTLSRLERNEHAILLQPTPPRAIIDQAVAAMRAKLDVPSCHFTLDVVEPLPDVLADRDALAMVLVNLLDNAVKYTGDEKRIDLRARDASGHIFISIQDNGLGFSKAERKNIFRRFYQVDQKLSRSGGGCGLGLALVQHIVEAHHGRVDVNSQLGRGSTFTVSVPIAKLEERPLAWKPS
jgi:signal transduction histidine kinase